MGKVTDYAIDNQKMYVVFDDAAGANYPSDINPIDHLTASAPVTRNVADPYGGTDAFDTTAKQTMATGAGTVPTDYLDLNSDFTIQYWFKTTSAGQVILISNGVGSGIVVGIEAVTGKLYVHSQPDPIVVTGLVVNDGEFHHVALGFDTTANTFKLVADGLQRVTGNQTGSSLPPIDHINGNNSVAAQQLTISEMFIVNAQLTNERIADYANINYMAPQVHSVRQASFYQRDNFPGLIGQYSGRSNSNGWEDMTFKKNDILHTGTPDRLNWENGIYVTSRLNGINEGGERLLSGADSVFMISALVNLDTMVEDAQNTIGCFTDNASSIFVTIQKDSFSGVVTVRAGRHDFEGLNESLRDLVVNSGWAYIQVTMDIDGEDLNITTRANGEIYVNTITPPGLGASISYSKIAIGYYYVSGTPINHAGIDLKLVAFGTEFITNVIYNTFLDVLNLVTPYLPPKSTSTIAQEAAGLVNKQGFPSGRVLMDEIGEVDFKVSGSAYFIENESADSHRDSAVMMPDANAGMWSVPLGEIDDGVGILWVWSAITLLGSLPSSRDLLEMWGYVRYEDAMIQRISTGLRGINRTFDDGASHNKSVGAGSDWVIGGSRQSFSCAIDRALNNKIAHVGPAANSGSANNVAWDWNDTIGDMWWSGFNGTPYIVSNFGFGLIYPGDADHIALDAAQSENIIHLMNSIYGQSCFGLGFNY